MEEGYKELTPFEERSVHRIVNRGFENGYPEQAVVDDLLAEGLSRPQAEEYVFSVYGRMKSSENKIANQMIVTGILLTIIGGIILWYVLILNPNRIFKITLIPLVVGVFTLGGGIYLKYK